MQVRQELVVPIHTDGRQQLGHRLVEAERQIRLAIQQAEASLACYRQALATLGELRAEVGATTSISHRAQTSLRTVGGPAPCSGTVGLDGWLEPAILTIARVSEPRHSTPLSPRETEVLALLAGGQSNKEIAYLLSLSTRTVERHINNIYRKIGVQNRSEATAYALRRQIA